jgi:uncharacterized zinc-type alcohol dehydrogenase-like protein
MGNRTFRGYAAQGAGGQLKEFEYKAPPMGENDVCIDISHCGVCHSDVQAIDDYYGITEYPFVPGHEIVGHVSALGRGVKGLKEGDRVGIGWQGRCCGKCEWCRRGLEQLCDKIVDCGTWNPYGGFSTAEVVDGSFAHPVPSDMASEKAAVFSCAGITVFSPLKELAAPRGRKIAIVGVGGLGHLAIQFARAFGYEVTAIPSRDGKRAEALAFGAHDFVAGDADSLRKREFTYDLLLYTSPGKCEWSRLFAALKKNGTLILVGEPDMDFNSTNLVAHQLRIQASFLGTRAEMREMLSFAQAEGIEPVVETMPMAQINDATRRVREGQAHYRMVLVN